MRTRSIYIQSTYSSLLSTSAETFAPTVCFTIIYTVVINEKLLFCLCWTHTMFALHWHCVCIGFELCWHRVCICVGFPLRVRRHFASLGILCSLALCAHWFNVFLNVYLVLSQVLKLTSWMWHPSRLGKSTSVDEIQKTIEAHRCIILVTKLLIIPHNNTLSMANAQ